MKTQPLPRLLSCKDLAAELGVNESTATRIMRRLPKVKVGSRVYVTDAEVAAYLKRETSS